MRSSVSPVSLSSNDVVLLSDQVAFIPTACPNELPFTTCFQRFSDIMSQVAADFADIDGLSIRIRQKGQVQQQHQPVPGVNADSQHVTNDAWKDFVDPDQLQEIEEAMHIAACAKKLASKAMQQLRVGEDEPDHIKWACLHKAVLHEAAAETEDPAVAKALLNIAAGYPSALAKIAARHAEEQQAMKREDPVVSLRREAEVYQNALCVRLRELKEETGRYQSMRAQLKELQQANAEVEASLTETSKQRAALAAKRAAENAVSGDADEQMVRPVLHLQYCSCTHPYHQSTNTNGMLCRSGTFKMRQQR